MISSRGFSQPRDQSDISCISCSAVRFFATKPSWKTKGGWVGCLQNKMIGKERLSFKPLASARSKQTA